MSDFKKDIFDEKPTPSHRNQVLEMAKRELGKKSSSAQEGSWFRGILEFWWTIPVAASLAGVIIHFFSDFLKENTGTSIAGFSEDQMFIVAEEVPEDFEMVDDLEFFESLEEMEKWKES